MKGLQKNYIYGCVSSTLIKLHKIEPLSQNGSSFASERLSILESSQISAKFGEMCQFCSKPICSEPSLKYTVSWETCDSWNFEILESKLNKAVIDENQAWLSKYEPEAQM